MRIEKETYSNERNDFKADFVCGQCGAKINALGYRDYNFFYNVIPNAICCECGKSESGETAEEQEIRLGRVYHI